MALRLSRVFFVAALMLGFGASARAAELTAATADDDALQWATHNNLFALYHEVSHLLVDQLSLPVLGREEDAADAMASYTLLEKHTRKDDVALTDAAYGWLLSSKRTGSELQDADFYNEHSLDMQRAYQIVCFMVGSDADAFRSVADKYGIDRDRQESCGREYQLLSRSLRNELGIYWDKNAKGTKINIIYHTASGRLKAAADAFKKSGVFEAIAKDLKSTYSLPETVNFRAKSCGQPNAFYDPATVEVIYCYELMDDFLAMYATGRPKKSVPAPAEGFGRVGSSNFY